MKRIATVALICAFAFLPAVHASTHNSGSHPHSSSSRTTRHTSASRPHYGGGHHTNSHGGTYPGSTNAHHKHGHYSNPKTNNQYGTHQ